MPTYDDGAPRQVEVALLPRLELAVCDEDPGSLAVHADLDGGHVGRGDGALAAAPARRATQPYLVDDLSHLEQISMRPNETKLFSSIKREDFNFQH